MQLGYQQHSRHTVLVVDDERRIRDTFSHLLSKEGYEVLTAADGEEALAQLEEKLPCLLLTDVMMPGMDGLTLCRRIKQNPRSAYLPVVFVTAKISDKDLQEGIAAGAVDYVKKPFDRGEVLMRVRNQILLHESLMRLTKTEQQLQVISKAAQDAVVVMDSNGRVSHWSRAAELIFGYSSDEALGQDFHSMLIPEQVVDGFSPNKPRLLKICKTGSLSNAVEVEAYGKGGQKIPAELSLSGIEVDEEWCTVAIVRDISERKRIEVELRHAQKLEAVGQLAAGIAHEINTPAQYVGDSITYLRSSFEDLRSAIAVYREMFDAIPTSALPEQLRDRVQQVEQSADLAYHLEQSPLAFERTIEGLDHVASIVNAMKEFAHQDRSDQSIANINRAIENTLTIAHGEYKYVAEVVTELSDLPLVVCHVGDLSQVFLNLIVNAAHAIEDVVGRTGDKGRITVRSVADGDRVRVEVADTGIGIPEGVRSRIFDPFFTTKEVGRGSGQGLAIAHSIVVDKHQGTLEVDTAEGQGTTFTITLPIDGRSTTQPEASA